MPRLPKDTILIIGLLFCSTMLTATISFGAVPTGSAWPDRANVINVRTFGARGDGRSDDTDAILAAIGAAAERSPMPIYFPAGVYLISDTLKRIDKDGHPTNALNLLGEGEENTKLLLADHAAGFGDPTGPKAVISTSSHLWQTTPTAGGKDWLGKGEGNQAFSNYITNMTIDIGKQNPGAVGIDYLANNMGAIRNVRIVDHEGNATTGISMTRKWPGPALLSHVEIIGFRIGIDVAQLEYSITIDTLRLERQSVVGLRNHSNIVAIRELSTIDDPHPIENLGSEALMVLVDAVLSAGREGDGYQATPAISNQGFLRLQNVQVLGFTRSVNEIQAAQHAFTGAFQNDTRIDGCDRPTNLEAFPAFTPAAAAQWISVVDFGAHADGQADDTEALNRAFASGAANIIIPYGIYKLSDTLVIPATVERVLGLYSTILWGESARIDTPMMRVEGEGGQIVLEELSVPSNDRTSVWIADAARRRLVLRDLYSPPSDRVMVERHRQAGELFIENICCGRVIAAGPAAIFAEQLNTEEGNATRIVLDGTPFSVLGIKTEGANTVIEATNGAIVSVLGGLLYPVRPVPGTLPAFKGNDAHFVLSYAESAYDERKTYRVEFAQAGGSEVTADHFAPRTYGRMVACYSTEAPGR